ncbi:MAG: hypothetical protein QHJ73_05810, partial [Armatimonadota bacterium]|nr:hypothetical protein [Armatimonadota bacterium]
MGSIGYSALRGSLRALLAALHQQSPAGKAICAFAVASLAVRLSVAFFGCGSGEKVVATTNPVSELSAAVTNWNKVLTGVRLRSYSEEGRIDTEARRAAVVQEITAPETAWLPVGNAARPETVTAMRISDNPYADAAAVAEWRARVAEQVK